MPRAQDDHRFDRHQQRANRLMQTRQRELCKGHVPAAVVGRQDVGGAQPESDLADEQSEQHPGCPEVDRMAKLNYKEYLESHCADATALEKVTSLDGDS